jgi:Abortive infection alpha
MLHIVETGGLVDIANTGALALVLKDAGPVAVDLAKWILGPMSDELGHLGGEWIRSYRINRIASALGKAAKRLEAAGIRPNSVRPGLLFPILEGASFEDDEDLHDMWANLLANAANPDVNEIRTAYVEILKQLSRHDVEFLNRVYEQPRGASANIKGGLTLELGTRMELPASEHTSARLPSGEVFRELALDQEILDSVMRAGLIAERDEVAGDPERTQTRRHVFFITTFGVRFLDACRPPGSKLAAEELRNDKRREKH